MLAGTKNSVQDVIGMKFEQHVHHLFVDRHSYMAAIWWYSEPAWQALPPDLRPAVEDAFRALAAATRRAALEREKPALAAFERSGGTIDYITPAQRTEFRAATQPLRAWYAERYGAQWLQRTDAAIAACERAGASTTATPEKS
jgi:TRAP-type C4-dicarboxylate transport system substrate-binding protein